MKSLFTLVSIPALLVISSLTLGAGQERASRQEVQYGLVGAWRLVWLEEPDADGRVHKADCTGMLVYTRDGHMSVQVMYRNPQTGGQAGLVQYVQNGYEASFGRYEIDEHSHTFNFHVEGALARGLIDKDLSRAYEISGNQLIVKSTNPNEHWRVAWEHY